MEKQTKIIRVTGNYGITYITIDDFKNSPIYNTVMFDNEGVLDADIQMAINIASFNINYLSGQQINKVWNDPAIDEEWKNLIIQATLQFVRYLCTTCVDWLRGSATFSQGGTAESQTNPADPYFVPPEVINLLKQAEVYQNTYFMTNPIPTPRSWLNQQFSLDGANYITWLQAVNTFVAGNINGKNNFKSSDGSVILTPIQTSMDNLMLDIKVDWDKNPGIQFDTRTITLAPNNLWTAIGLVGDNSQGVLFYYSNGDWNFQFGSDFPVTISSNGIRLNSKSDIYTPLLETRASSIVQAINEINAKDANLQSQPINYSKFTKSNSVVPTLASTVPFAVQSDVGGLLVGSSKMYIPSTQSYNENEVGLAIASTDPNGVMVNNTEGALGEKWRFWYQVPNDYTWWILNDPQGQACWPFTAIAEWIVSQSYVNQADFNYPCFIPWSEVGRPIVVDVVSVDDGQTSVIGNIKDLATTDKTNLVLAINSLVKAQADTRSLVDGIPLVVNAVLTGDTPKADWTVNGLEKGKDYMVKVKYLYNKVLKTKTGRCEKYDPTEDANVFSRIHYNPGQFTKSDVVTCNLKGDTIHINMNARALPVTSVEVWRV